MSKALPEGWILLPTQDAIKASVITAVRRFPKQEPSALHPKGANPVVLVDFLRGSDGDCISIKCQTEPEAEQTQSNILAVIQTILENEKRERTRHAEPTS